MKRVKDGDEREPSEHERVPESAREQHAEVGTAKFAVWATSFGFLCMWSLRNAVAGCQFAWRKRGPLSLVRRAVIAASITVPVLAVANRHVFADYLDNWQGHLIGVTLAVVGFQALLGSGAALLAMPQLWALLLRGELPAGKESAIHGAGWRAACSDAKHRIATRRFWMAAHPRVARFFLTSGVVGARIFDDHRWWVARFWDQLSRAPATWIRRGLVSIPTDMPRLLVLACSGHGKTVAISVLTGEALRMSTRPRVVVIDCKGSRSDADDMRDSAESRGKTVVCWPESPLDLWRGDANECVSIVKTMLPNHPYWESLGEAVLVAISRDAGAWRSTNELFERLRNPARFVSDRATLAVLTQKVSGGIPAHLAVHQIVFAKLAPIADLIDGGADSWALDDEHVDLVVMSADIGADVRLAPALTGFIACLNSYRIARRDDGDRPMLVAIDEIQVLLGLEQPPDLAWLAEQCRSQRIGLILATQSVAGLGESAPRLLGAGMDLLLGRLDDPSVVAPLGGTRRIAEMGWQKKARRFTSTATARSQHIFRIDPNRQRSLDTWSWCLLSKGQIAYVLVPPPSRSSPVLGDLVPM